MHIGLIIYGSLETLSGGYLYDRKLVAHLREAGDTVTVLSQPWVNYGRHLLQNFDAAGLRQQALGQQFDVLLQDELNHPSLFWQNPALRKQLGCPLVSIVHHLRCSEAWRDWQNALYRHIERRYLNTVDGFVFNSQTTRQTVFDLIGAAKPHVVALPAGDRFGRETGLDDWAKQTMRSKNHELRLLFVGNLMPRKGLHTVLAALATCTRGWQLDVVGSASVDTAYAQSLRAQTEQLGLTQQVHWRGRLDDADLAEAFRQHDVLVGPSSYEGFGIAYLEALGFGLPVIASTGGAAHEIVTDGVNGFLVDPGDTVTLSARVNTLIDNPLLLTRMAEAARQRFAQHPTWADSMARIRSFLQQLPSNTRSP